MYKKILVSSLIILIVVFTAVLGSCDGAGKFKVSNLIIEPDNAIAGETVTVSVDVTNTGDSEDTYNVILFINDVEDSSNKISLASDTSQTITFYLT